MRATDGALRTWNPSPDGEVDALAVFGGRISVGGAWGPSAARSASGWPLLADVSERVDGGR